ncbi:unnamed protein product [Orchesella dallaii]|uniref:Uncharacterized protein n=1 Tax=Orchesella dallaii TaxID=48710 RepID=A0ABP1RXV6_9HEXA
MDALKRKRGVEKGNITKALTWINSIDKDQVTLVYLKNKRAIIEEYFTNFKALQGQIEDACADDAELALQVGEREDYENRYLEVVSTLDNIVDEKTPDAQPTPTASSGHSSSSHTRGAGVASQ